jgi:hypothetical protein
MTLMTDCNDQPLRNRDGRQFYQVNEPLVYRSDVASTIIKVPEGFVTDLASIPRLPFVYLLLNGFADEAGVVHDYLYSVGTLPRDVADKVLYEACILTGVSAWKASAIYAGVRVGGASHYMRG